MLHFRNINLGLLTSILLLLTIVAYSCSDRSRVEYAIKDMKSKKVVLPLEEMTFCRNNSHYNEKIDFEYKLVVFVDSSRCSSCFIKHLSIWNDYLLLEKQGKVQLLFIVETPKTELDYYFNETRFSHINHPVYFDTETMFRRNNPHIPEDKRFHVFLIDKTSKVVLVGNPVTNSRVDEMFRNIINNS